MSEIVTTVVAALAWGAAVVPKEFASAAVKDAYAGLKKLILDRFKGTDPFVAAVEADPLSSPEQIVLSKQLIGVHEHADIKASALVLLEALEALQSEPNAQALLDFDRLRAAKTFKLRDIELSGSLLRAKDAQFDGDFTAEGIRQRQSSKN